jgi:hypothetical protein
MVLRAGLPRALSAAATGSEIVAMATICLLACSACASTPPPGGADAGGGPPCADDGSCPTGMTCVYDVGSCSAKGYCLETQGDICFGPCCANILCCGCDGRPVQCACGASYARGPTLGEPAPCAGTKDAGGG